MRFSCFLVLPGSAVSQHIWGGTVKCLLIDYFIDNISAKNIIPSQHDSRANGSITARKRQLDRSSRFDLRLSIRQCDRRKNGQLPVPYSISTAGYGALERKKTSGDISRRPRRKRRPNTAEEWRMPASQAGKSCNIRAYVRPSRDRLRADTHSWLANRRRGRRVRQNSACQLNKWSM